MTAFGDCGMISETTQSACLYSDVVGMVFFTAGQRMEPRNVSTFVWRLTSTDTYSDTVSVMRYTDWDDGQPNGGGRECVCILSAMSYKWHDADCIYKFCSVCEIDIP